MTSPAPDLQVTESRRSELEIVVAALSKTPRLAKLLRYIGNKCVVGKFEDITEYNIATEVFGRSKDSFDPYRDSVARVEAHRLRKRLKQYYDTEGIDHEILISLPTGGYLPSFTQRALPAVAVSPIPSQGPEGIVPARTLNETLPPDTSDTRDSAPNPKANPSPWRSRAYGIGAFALLLLNIAFLVRTLPKLNRTEPMAGTASAAPSSVVPTSAGVAQIPLRLLAGYSGNQEIDSAGVRWYPDNYFHYGGTVRLSIPSIERTSDPMLFDHARNGDFLYEIPLTGGPYELHLYFAISSTEPSTFSVKINGQSVLNGFDINTDAMGSNVADERVFRDVFPNREGKLAISFNSEMGMPYLSALEVLPGIPHKQLPIRIVAQPTAVLDHDGNYWHPDTYFVNGHQRDEHSEVTGTSNPDLYARERYGNFSYAIPVDTRDRYTLILHFAELYFGTDGQKGSGNRVFRVLCNGTTLLDDFDIQKEVGGLNALIKTFYHLRPSAQGKLNLTFEPIVNNATVSAIEVIDESR